MDRETVIRELEVRIISDTDKGYKTIEIPVNEAEDILSMLKKHEPKPVGKEWNECPSCGKTLDRIHDMHYCGVCGQAVKWDD